MKPAKTRRQRGVVLTPRGCQRLQDARRRLEFRENFADKYTMEALSERTGLSPRTLAKVMSGEHGVDKRTLENCFHAFDLELSQGDYLNPAKDNENDGRPPHRTRLDLEEAPHVATFYGRQQELADLKQMILKEHARLVLVLGMGGVGKTSLCVELVQQTHREFDFVAWRSLQTGLPAGQCVGGLVRFLKGRPDLVLPESLEERVYLLVECLRVSRCLIVLDNVETLLVGGQLAGQYGQGFEEYALVFKLVTHLAHQSCLVLTSREQLGQLVAIEGVNLPVRQCLLAGLPEPECRQILLEKGLAADAIAEDAQALIRCYAGNPLALKIVASTIRDLFSGKIAAFLAQGAVAFGNVRELLDQQLHRVSELERDLLYWFAINREPVLLAQLHEDILLSVSKPRMLEAIESLRRRCLVECSGERFLLQPLVLEHLSEQFVERLYQELLTTELVFFKRFALLKAQSPEYIQSTQTRLLLDPTVNRLLATFECRISTRTHLHQVLTALRHSSLREPGYAAGNLLNLLCRLDVDFSHFDFSHLAIWQADLRGACLQNINFAHARFSRSAFTAALSTLSCVAFSPDGRLLATSEVTGEIWVWQLKNSQQQVVCRGHTSWVWSVAWNPEGNLLASGSADQTIRLWDTASGQCLTTLHGHTSGVRSVAFAPFDCVGGAVPLLASGGEDHCIRLWSLESGQCVQVLRGHTGWIYSVAFDPDGRMLASAGQDGTIRLWQIDTGREVKILKGHTSWVRSVAFSPDGQLLASSSDDQTVRLWDIRTGSLVQVLQGHSGWVRSVAFSPDGRVVASGSDDQTVRLWDVTGRSLGVLQGHTDWVSSVAFSPHTQLLASCGSDHCVRLWEIESGQCLKLFQGYGGGISSVAICHDGSLLASGSIDHSVQLWDPNTVEPLKTLRGHLGSVRSVVFSPDGRLLASGSQDKTIRLWDLQSRRCLRVLQGHQSWIQSLAFSPDGRLLASASVDQSVKLWSISTGRCLQTLNSLTWVRSVAFSPDGLWIASGGQDGTVKIWESASGRCVRTLDGHTSWVRSVAFAPQQIADTPADRPILTSAGDDCTLQMWDVRTGTLLRTLTGHGGGVWSVAYTPDARVLASGSDDLTVRLWDTQTGRCLRILRGHHSGVLSVVAGHDNRLLASSSADETVILWDLETGARRGLLKINGPYSGMDITQATGLTEAQKAMLKALGATETEPVLG